MTLFKLFGKRDTSCSQVIEIETRVSSAKYLMMDSVMQCSIVEHLASEAKISCKKY